MNAFVKMLVLSKMYILMFFFFFLCMLVFKYIIVFDFLYIFIDKILRVNNVGKMVWCIYVFFFLIFRIDVNVFLYRAFVLIEFVVVVLLWGWFLLNLLYYVLIGMFVCVFYRCNNYIKNRFYVIFIFYIYSFLLEFIYLLICLY